MDRTTRTSEAPAARFVLAALVIAALTTQLSCATTPASNEGPRPQPAARLALPPEYRLFYDALQDYGDWVLIQPYGYVFRPRNNIVGWQPYYDGFWAANDLYGWVWVSAEPFGWATYHYGRWFYDEYDGWVWVPGTEWGPGWVTWEMSDDYVGWAPSFARGASTTIIPGGGFLYAPVSALGATDLPGHVVPKERVEVARRGAQRVENPTEVGGVVINRGPSFERVAQKGGYISHMAIDEAPAAVPQGVKTPVKGAGVSPAVEATRRQAEAAALRAQEMMRTGGQPPARMPIIRAPAKHEHAPQKAGPPEHPEGKAEPEHPEGKAHESPAGKAAPPDSSRQ